MKPTEYAPLRVDLSDTEPQDWVEVLNTPNPGRDDALRRLHELLLRAVRHQVSQMYSTVVELGDVALDDIVNQAADEAMVTLLGKLSSFEGRSRFTTWAYKFGILQAAVEVRRLRWRDREVSLDERVETVSLDASPEQHAEATDFLNAVGDAIERSLTDHQRAVVLALLVDEVPVDVLAERLETSRNALYKTLHDARKRLRGHLATMGYFGPTTPKGGSGER